MKLSLSRHPVAHTPPANDSGATSAPAYAGADLEHALSTAFDQMLAQRHPSPQWHSSSQPTPVSLTLLSLPSTHHQSRTTLATSSSRPIAVYEPSPTALRDMSVRHRQLKRNSAIQHSSSSTRQYIDANGRRPVRRRKTRGVKLGLAPSSVFPPMSPSSESITSEETKSWVEDAEVTLQYLQTESTPSSAGPSQTTSETSSVYPASTPPSSPTFSSSTPRHGKMRDPLTEGSGAVRVDEANSGHTHPRSPPAHDHQSSRRHPPASSHRSNVRRYRKSKILANNNFYLPPLFSDDALLSSTHLPCQHSGLSGDSRVVDSRETLPVQDSKHHRHNPILTLCTSPKALEPLSEAPTIPHPKTSPLVAATTAFKSLFFARSNRNKPKETSFREQPAVPAEEVWRTNVLTQAVTQCLVSPPEPPLPYGHPSLTPRASKQTLKTITHHSTETLTTNKPSSGARCPGSSSGSAFSISDGGVDGHESCEQSEISSQDGSEGTGPVITGSPPPPPVDVLASFGELSHESFYHSSSISSSTNLFEHSTNDSRSSSSHSENSDTLSALWRALADPGRPPSDHVEGKTILEELVFREDNEATEERDHGRSKVMDWRIKLQHQEANAQASLSTCSH